VPRCTPGSEATPTEHRPSGLAGAQLGAATRRNATRLPPARHSPRVRHRNIAHRHVPEGTRQMSVSTVPDHNRQLVTRPSEVSLLPASDTMVRTISEAGRMSVTRPTD
jgi:hypothetical protein